MGEKLKSFEEQDAENLVKSALGEDVFEREDKPVNVEKKKTNNFVRQVRRIWKTLAGNWNSP